MELINFKDRLKKETGSGIGVVIYGVVIMLVLCLVSINIMNAKLIQEGYDRLRDSLEAAVAGSVLHIAMDKQTDTIKDSGAGDGNINKGPGSDDNYQLEYDPWLQLALGFLMKSDMKDESASVDISALNGNTVENDYIKFDRKKVVTHTMRVLHDGVFGRNAEAKDITDTTKFKIKMIFLEPAYDKNLGKSIDVIVYDNSMFNPGTLQPEDDAFKGKFYSTRQDGGSFTSDEALIGEVQRIINTYAVSGVTINLGADENLAEKLQTRPYYFVIIENFALPTLYGDTTGFNIFKSLTPDVLNTGQVGPMFALQGANTKRVLEEDQTGIK